MFKFTGTFRGNDGQLLGLDFYADNRSLALAHAATVAYDAKLTVVKVRQLRDRDVYDAGTFYPLKG